ncbi:hypothetical protein [Streptomyces caniscabiei]|uniref:hypothetical protein n=1 Tax=Streptomyces caniscabiei TaxID=2746961 RepID=UPI000AA020C4|nr:hypothetical protein [Streptomyces caniscabiei]
MTGTPPHVLSINERTPPFEAPGRTSAELVAQAALTGRRSHGVPSRPGKSGTQTLDWSAEGKLSKLTENGVTTDCLYSADF